MKLDYLIAATGLFLAFAVGTVSAQPAGPPADFEMHPEHHYVPGRHDND